MAAVAWPELQGVSTNRSKSIYGSGAWTLTKSAKYQRDEWREFYGTAKLLDEDARARDALAAASSRRSRGSGRGSFQLDEVKVREPCKIDKAALRRGLGRSAARRSARVGLVERRAGTSEGMPRADFAAYDSIEARAKRAPVTKENLVVIEMLRRSVNLWVVARALLDASDEFTKRFLEKTSDLTSESAAVFALAHRSSGRRDAIAFSGRGSAAERLYGLIASWRARPFTVPGCRVHLRDVLLARDYGSLEELAESLGEYLEQRRALVAILRDEPSLQEVFDVMPDDVSLACAVTRSKDGGVHCVFREKNQILISEFGVPRYAVSEPRSHRALMVLVDTCLDSDQPVVDEVPAWRDPRERERQGGQGTLGGAA